MYKLYYFYLSKQKCSKVFNNIECSRVSLGQARDFFGMTDTLIRFKKSYLHGNTFVDEAEGEIWSNPICACDCLSASSTRDLGGILQIKYLHHIIVVLVCFILRLYVSTLKCLN